MCLLFRMLESLALVIRDITVGLLQEVGYHHGKTLLNGWIKGGLIDELFKDKHSDHFSKCNIHKVQVSTWVMYLHYITSWKFWLSEKLNDFIYSYKHIIEKTETNLLLYLLLTVDEKKNIQKNLKINNFLGFYSPTCLPWPSLQIWLS